MPARQRKRAPTHVLYPWAHQQERRRLEPAVATGTVRCARAALGQCLMPSPLIHPGQPWDLGHPDHDRTRWSGPEHQRCNRAAAARIGNRTRAVAARRSKLPQW
jgi:hypothetical protein